MNVVSVYVTIYARCLRDALAAIGRNAWTLLVPAAILLVRGWAGGLAVSFGVLGGILVTVVSAALFSCYLYVLDDLVRGGRVAASVAGLKASLGAFLWPVVNVFFVVWIATFVLQLLVGTLPNGPAIVLALWLVATVAFNAVPEVIYLRGTHGGVETIGGSWDFLKQQWIPWFAVNVPLLMVLGLVAITAGQVAVVGDVLAGAVLHVVMVFRGHLFRALDGTTHRRRMFQQKFG